MKSAPQTESIPQDLLILVRLMKGSSAKSQVLLAFIFARAINGMVMEDLQNWTDLGREPIYHACSSLERPPLGLLSHQVNAHGSKRWFPTGAMLPVIRALNSGTPELSQGSPELPGVVQDDSWLPGVVRDDSWRLKSTTTTTPSREDPNSLPLVVVVASQESSETTPGSQTFYETIGVTFETNLAACKKHNIGQPKAGILSRMPHVSPELIKSHVESLGPGETIGLAILRIESGELPRLWLDSIAEAVRRGPPARRNDPLEIEQDEDDEIEMHCLWTEELDEILESGPHKGRHVRGKKCSNVITNGSMKWCDEHLQIGIETYGK